MQNVNFAEMIEDAAFVPFLFLGSRDLNKFWRSLRLY